MIAKKRLETAYVDIGNAYLNALLKETLYMNYPDGFEDEFDTNDKVCLLKRSIYGLKQSAANWSNTLGNFLLKNGFAKSSADLCLYIKRSSSRSN
jgi:hypothetical protein